MIYMVKKHNFSGLSNRSKSRTFENKRQNT